MPNRLEVLLLWTDSWTLTEAIVEAAGPGVNAHPDAMKFKPTPPTNVSHATGGNRRRGNSHLPEVGLDRC